MKLNILTLAASLAVLFSATQSATAQVCLPVTELAAVRTKQAVTLTWQNPDTIDAVLCYRWTLQSWGWQLDTQWTIPPEVSTLTDTAVLSSKTYQYAITAHYPCCGWAPWQYVILGPYSSSGSSTPRPGK